MGRPKKVVKTVKAVKVVKEAKVEKVVTLDKRDLRKEYDRLLAEIIPNLLTHSQLKQGGSGVRSRYALEQGYAKTLPEINEIGRQLGLPKIGLGNLRRA